MVRFGVMCQASCAYQSASQERKFLETRAPAGIATFLAVRLYCACTSGIRPTRLTAAMSYVVELLGSTAGKPNAAGLRLPPLPAAPPANQKGLVLANVMLAASVARVLVILRMLVPTWSVCLPLVQVTSSVKLCTGI